MKHLLIIFLLIPSLCYAHRVCLEKSTGKIIQYQSGSVDAEISKQSIEIIAGKDFNSLTAKEIKDADTKIRKNRLDSIKNYVLANGYKEEDIEVKEVTNDEWKIIREEQIEKPAKERMIQQEIERKQKEEAIKLKLNLSDKDFQDLREALK